MATVTAMLDKVCRVTGLRTTGSERAHALQALNNAYQRSVMDSECNPAYVAYTFVASSDSYALSTVLGEQPLRLLHVSLGASAGSLGLQQVSHQELLDHRANESVVGTPMMYATVGFDRIAFYPNPGVGEQVKIWYIDDVPELVESGPTASQESTPTKIPTPFHYDVLYVGAVCEALDKDQRQKEADYWENKYRQGLARLEEHIGQFGGEANRAYTAASGGRLWYRDSRSRG